MKRGTRRLAAALLSLVLFALAGCAPKALPEASAPAEAAGDKGILEIRGKTCFFGG